MFFVTAGATDQTIDIFLQDSSSSTGGGLTGLTHASSGLTCYFRKGATGTVTQLTLASQTVGGAHTDGGFVELDSTNAPGTYRLDLSDAMVSTEGTLTIYLHGATNLLQTPIRVHVASATRGYTGTALPAAAADAAGGLVVSDAGGLDIDTYLGRITGNVALASSLPSNFSLLGINGSGHVSRVTLTDTTTTNTDMRGTDSAFLAASAPSNFSSLGINASGHVSRVTLVDTTTTNSDMVAEAPTAAAIYTEFTTGTNEDVFKADVSALATSASISALNDLSSADVTAAVPTAASIADAVLDEALSGHNVAGSVGKALRQIKEATVTVESSVNDLSATTTSFVTDLTEATDDFYNDKVLVFNGGTLSGQARVISDYNGTTKAITLDEALTSAPSDADSFIILATHEHSISDIQAGLATAASITALNDISVADVLTSVLTESYSTDGAAPTLTQAVMLILQHLSESSITGTTKTVKQLDGSTTAATFTLDDASSPSSITRAT
jgi:hypothetical protein